MTPHNEAKIEDISNIVLMPGDPYRAKKIAMKYLEDPILVTDVPAEGVSATLVTIPAIPVGRSYSTLPRSVQASADLFSLSEAAYT